MQRLKAAAILAVTAAALFAAAPAGAATTTISIVLSSGVFSFSPKSVTIAQGDTAAWHNTTAVTHTSTQNATLSLWNTGNIASGSTGSTVIKWAGSFPYHCAIHLYMTGTVRVPIQVSPSSGTTSTTFTITMATAAPPSGDVFDVQMRVGSSGTWGPYRSGLTGTTTTFRASSAGTYFFRSRLRNMASGGASKYSPGKSVTVS